MTASSHRVSNISVRLRCIEALAFLFLIPFTAYMFILLKCNHESILKLQEANSSLQKTLNKRLTQIENKFITMSVESQKIGKVEKNPLQKLSNHSKPTSSESISSSLPRNLLDKTQDFLSTSMFLNKNMIALPGQTLFTPIHERLAQIEKDFIAPNMKLKVEKVEKKPTKKPFKHHEMMKRVRVPLVSMNNSFLDKRHKHRLFFRPLKKQKTRKLKDSVLVLINENLARENSTSDCTKFSMNIELDENSSETMWILFDEKERNILANMTYRQNEAHEVYTYDFCLMPSQYSLTIFDSDGDGINCRSKLKDAGKSCYSYMINGEFKEGINFSSMSKHDIDTNRRCLLEPLMILKLHFSTDDVHSDFTLLNTETGHTDYEFLQTTDTRHTNTTETYYICMKPGMYEIIIKGTNSTGSAFTCDNSCYDILIEQNPIIVGPSILDGSPVSFYVNTEWMARKRICHKQPILAAINDVSNFMFDDRAFKILNVFQAISSLENLILPGKAQYRAACFVIYDDANYVGAEDPFLLQRYTLALFLYATNQSPELDLPKYPCLSDKYSCNEMNEIIGIDWSRYGIEGSIPTEIAHFTKLEFLVMNKNEFSGTIPTEIAKLKKLNTLELSGNKLTGNVPSTIGLMQNLEVLVLNQNRFSGKIPSEIGNLSRLCTFSLYSNRFTGSIPPDIFNHHKLETFSISNNKLTGSIPSEIAQCDHLRMFLAENNILTGIIPSEIGEMALLEYFDISHNRISGTIPSEIKNLNWRIQEILLHSNKLTGSLPPLTVQDKLFVSQNKLTGDIPEAIWGLNITGLHLEDNKLKGAVSCSFCANLNFVGGLEGEGIYDLSVDNSRWFLDDPMVTCPCCDDNVCHLWENDETVIVRGTRKPRCPRKNVFTTKVFSRYVLHDLVADVYKGGGVGFGVEEVFDICLSPTGCFEMQVDVKDSFRGGGPSFDKMFRFGYSAAARGLIEHNSCDAVSICGTLFAADHPKRMGLNHLTHIVFPDLSYLDDTSSPEYKALCWIMTKDVFFHDCEICNGTLLQRYVMALFYYSMQESIGFDVLPSTHTCDWLGVTCNPTRLFVEELQLPGLGLAGKIISEIGLLTRLRRLDLSRNKLSGTIDRSMFGYLPNLKIFDLSENKLSGKISLEMMMLPSLKEFNVSNNMLVGDLPQNINYTKSFESFDVENNLLTGWIPRRLIACPNLVEINLSRNFFRGAIPSTIGFLDNLKILKLNQNSFSGSLPAYIFNAKSIEIFQVQSNSLTSSIPTTIGYLQKALVIGMNHNSFKGQIPEAFESLEQLEFLHLHSNQLTGQAPSFPHLLKLGERERYTSDCGNPFYKLANPISCETCTTCCNSDGMCQDNRIRPVTVVGMAFILLVCIPIVIFVLMYIFRSCIPDSRDPEDLVDEDSTYCLVFSDSKVAWFLHAFTLLLQGCIYYPYLLASSFTHKSSDWQFTIRCPASKVYCNDESTVSTFGWFLFYAITIPTLGVDFTRSVLQIQKAVSLSDLRLFCSGFLHLGVTILSIFASIHYNLALATSNTILILNAVILLFINDLDEQLMNVLHALLPNWTDERIAEIRTNLSIRKRETSQGKEEEKKVEDPEKEPQRLP